MSADFVALDGSDGCAVFEALPIGVGDDIQISFPSPNQNELLITLPEAVALDPWTEGTAAFPHTTGSLTEIQGIPRVDDLDWSDPGLMAVAALEVPYACSEQRTMSPYGILNGDRIWWSTELRWWLYVDSSILEGEVSECLLAHGSAYGIAPTTLPCHSALEMRFTRIDE